MLGSTCEVMAVARLSQTSEGTGVATARHIRPFLKKGLAGIIGCFNLQNTQVGCVLRPQTYRLKSYGRRKERPF